MRYIRESRTVRELRQKLLARGFTRLPRCPLCGTPQAIRDFAPHTRQCERDCLSRTIEHLDRQLAIWWSTDPSSAAERDAQDLWAESWRQERCEAWEALMATTPYEPGWPHDGMPL